MTPTGKQTKNVERPQKDVSEDPENASGGLTVRRLGAEEWSIWDKLFICALHVTPFASSKYLRQLADSLERSLSVYIVSRGGEVLAGIALCGRTYLGAKIVTAVPSTPYSAILYSRSAFASTYPARNTSEYIALSRSLIGAVRAEFRSLDLNLVPGVDDVRPWIWDGWRAEPTFTYLLHLKGELRVSYSVQKNARKCERSGAKASTEWDLDNCWSLLEKTSARQGVSIGMNRAQFFALAQTLYDSNLAWMVTVYNAENQPVASRVQLSVPGSNTAYDWVAGTSPAAFAIGASPWNVLKVIEECSNRGYAYWNMCGANFETIAKFKSEFGGDLVHGFSLRSPRPFIYSLVAKARLKASSLKQQLRKTKRK